MRNEQDFWLPRAFEAVQIAQCLIASSRQVTSFWAQSDRDWILDGAAVHVSMIGFDHGSETSSTLDGPTVVETINSDLTEMTDVTQRGTLPENVEHMLSRVSRKAGAFDIDRDSCADDACSARKSER